MNYWDYIKVERLLSLQTGLDDPERPPGNDESLFITVHQVYELWFKLVLTELHAVRRLFRRNPVPDQNLAAAVRSLRRCVRIFEVATHHWQVVETLTTRDYLAFRDQLVGASGFQSPQMREIEIILGLDDGKRVACAGETSYKELLEQDGKTTWALDKVEARIAEGASYKEALYEWLARTPIDGSSDPAHVDEYIARFLRAHEQQSAHMLALSLSRTERQADRELLERRYKRDTDRAVAFLTAEGCEDPARVKHIRAALLFIESHRELPRLAWPREVVDTTLGLEQSMIVWRQRHARMVEFTIGRRTGTGGSGGVDYLDQTALKYRIFDELWAVRTMLLRKEVVPSLSHAEDYRFRVEDTE